MRSTLPTLGLVARRLLFELPPETPERAAELLGGMSGRDTYAPALQRWLRRQAASFREPIGIEILDSVHDHGVDVLLSGLTSEQRVGFQIKSDRDVGADGFTEKLKAQIHDSELLDVSLLVVVFACAPQAHHHKIMYWLKLNHCQQLDGRVFCLVPERAASLLVRAEGPSEEASFASGSWAVFFEAVELALEVFSRRKGATLAILGACRETGTRKQDQLAS